MSADSVQQKSRGSMRTYADRKLTESQVLRSTLLIPLWPDGGKGDLELGFSFAFLSGLVLQVLVVFIVVSVLFVLSLGCSYI